MFFKILSSVFCSGQAGLYRPIYSASTLFALLGRLTHPPSRKNPRSGLGIWSQRSYFSGLSGQITFKIVTALNNRRDLGLIGGCAPVLSERTQASGINVR